MSVKVPNHNLDKNWDPSSPRDLVVSFQESNWTILGYLLVWRRILKNWSICQIFIPLWSSVLLFSVCHFFPPKWQKYDRKQIFNLLYFHLFWSHNRIITLLLTVIIYAKLSCACLTLSVLYPPFGSVQFVCKSVKLFLNATWGCTNWNSQNCCWAKGLDCKCRLSKDVLM